MEFDDFFTLEGPRLLRLCWLLTLDHGVAAELAQETMTRAWTSWDQLSQADQNPGAWARTVALNLVRSRARRLSLFSRHRQTLQQTPTRFSVSDPHLLEALQKLSTKQREVVVLRYWGDMTLNDCAEAMGVSLGSVKQHLTRAHRHLQKALDPTHLEELTL